MLLGLTEYKQEEGRIAVLKKIRVVSTFFFCAVFLPFLFYFLFYFGILSDKTAFSSDIQEPVAKVVTSDGSIGTAFLISTTYLITARHVVEGSQIGEEVELFFEHSKNKNTMKAKIKYYQKSEIKIVDNQVPIEYFLSDIAILEVPEIDDIEPLILGESENVNNLDEVVLIGYPNGDYSISKGNINSDKYQGLDLFKLDAASNPGNSGGPCILLEDNTVIGVLVGGSGADYQGENIALKAEDVKKFLNSAGINY